jgi:hypothetical protein
MIDALLNEIDPVFLWVALGSIAAAGVLYGILNFFYPPGGTKDD